MSGHAPNGHTHGHGLDLVPLRPLVEETVDIRFALSPGDRVIAEEGSAVTVGDPLAERFRDTVLAATTVPEGEDARPGERWTPTERARSTGTLAQAGAAHRRGAALPVA